MSQSPGVIVAEDVRAGLLALHGGSQTRVMNALKPPFSTSTNYRAITGRPVGEDVRSWFHSRYWGMTLRSYKDEDLLDALEVARKYLQDKLGRKIHGDDFKREVALVLRQEEQ